MIETTVADLLDDNLNVDTDEYYLYVIRDGDVVFYVEEVIDVRDCDGKPLAAGDAVTFQLGGQVLKGVALALGR